MTKEQLDAIRARLAVMSPGPWNWKAQRYYANNDSLLAAGNWGLNGPRTIEDAEVCAHVPTDLRALLDEVERLTKREDELVKAGLDLMVANKDLTIKRDTPFRRGAEAMRMAVRAEFKRWFLAKEPMVSFVRNLQGLPIPEDR
jgi:hypothetical protein